MLSNSKQRSYSPHTPSTVVAQPNAQMSRTPIQMMQQQTQSISMPGSQAPGINSPVQQGQQPLSTSASQESIRKRQHATTISNMGSQHASSMANSSVGSATSAAAIAIQNQQLEALNRTQNKAIRKKGKLRDKIIPQKVRELVPDSESYMDLLAFERKLDATIMRKRLDIQEALKRPIKVGFAFIFAVLSEILCKSQSQFIFSFSYS
jgi:hypothetical protein